MGPYYMQLVILVSKFYVGCSEFDSKYGPFGFTSLYTRYIREKENQNETHLCFWQIVNQ